MNTDKRNLKFVIRNSLSRDSSTNGLEHADLPITNHQLPITGCTAFTLVEVTLAVGVVAVGLVAILALFPLGLRATRSALDDTQMATIAEEFISKYQQAALSSTNYANFGNWTTTLTNYASGIFTNYVEATNTLYLTQIVVTNEGYSTISTTNAAPTTNLISRVTIQIWRPGSKTNFYVTEVARYVGAP
jgi:uncharacterized protein (TIGR02598 family)